MALRRSLPTHVRLSSSAGSTNAAWRPDLRELKQEHIALARERVFGPQGKMPGDRYFQKRLEGRKLMRWYFPSKYNLQDFRVDEYFEMQAERFAPREPHRCLPELTQTLEKVSQHREELRVFFQGMNEATFRDSPSLQDLYGLFRLVDADQALPFLPSERIFKEHGPLCSQAPPFRAAAASGPEAVEDPELFSLLELIKMKLGESAGLALESRIVRLDKEEVRELLLQEAHRLQLVLPLEHTTVVLEQPNSSKVHETTHSDSSDLDKVAASFDEITEGNMSVEEGEADSLELSPPALLGSWIFGGDQQYDISSDEDGRLRMDFALPEGKFARGILELLDEQHHANLEDGEVGQSYEASLNLEDGTPYGDIRLRFDEAQDSIIFSFRSRKRSRAKWGAEIASSRIRLDEPEQDADQDTGHDDDMRADLDPVEPVTAVGEIPTSQPKTQSPKAQLVTYLVEPGGGRKGRTAAREAQKEASKELADLREKGPKHLREYLSRRHRFIDPMYRRRRLKWLERQMAGWNKEKEEKFNGYYATHPDATREWPTNKASVTVVWPSPYHST